MASSEAPWLQGLSDAWDPPAEYNSLSNVSSASQDANTVTSNGKIRSGRRSPSGLSPALSSPRPNPLSSSQKRRDPLAPLSGNDTNTWRRYDTVKSASALSASHESDLSSIICGRVQQRSKSSSPAKKQQTLEWKRRLVQGQLGYGDQTDLFGPSGLENIFAKSKGNENEAPKSRMGWLARSKTDIPSSPPPWPSSLADRSLERREGDDRDYDGSEKEDDSEHGILRSSSHEEVKEVSHSTDDDVEEEVSTVQQSSSPQPSKCQPEHHEAHGNRTFSGQTDVSQEDFSPVFISKHTSINGEINYAALDSHQLKAFQSLNSVAEDSIGPSSQKEDSEHEQLANFDSSQITNDYANDTLPVQQDNVDFSQVTENDANEHLSVEQDLSFSENLLTGSPVPDLGNGVQFTRGGYSHHNSFRQLPLSDTNTPAEQPSRQASSQLRSSETPNIGLRPSTPHLPKSPRTPAQHTRPDSKSSRSPLKLFGDHDTFTNNRLLRRLSQLNPDGTLAIRPKSMMKGPNEAIEEMESSRVASGSSFGNGELNGHAFAAEITITGASDSGDEEDDRSPNSEVFVPGARSPQGFRLESSPENKDPYKLKRKLSRRSAAPSQASSLRSQRNIASRSSTCHHDAQEPMPNALSVPDQYTEGKRPPTSPCKDPTPKRRRTLHALEFEEGMSEFNNSYHSQLQDAINTRKHGGGSRVGSQGHVRASMSSQRKFLRPRNPTPSQRSRQQIEHEVRECTEEFVQQNPERLAAVIEQIESSMCTDSPPSLEQQARILASEVSKFTERGLKRYGSHEQRKRSVTTQDFFNEAQAVMRYIRTKNQNQTALHSVENSSAEMFGHSLGMRGSRVNSQRLRLSRPPSREGSGWRSRGPAEIDLRVINHLRKFQEGEDKDDTGFIADSKATLDMRDLNSAVSEQAIPDHNSNIIVTGPSSDPPRGDDEEQQRSPVSPRSDDSEFDTYSTQGSGAIYTTHTYGTTSTRKSDNVGTLAPNDVAHLIGEQVGGMTFDKEKQRWVRVPRKTRSKRRSEFLEPPSNLTSEDDPFREISDLAVDEQKELRRISSPAKVMSAQIAAAKDDSHHEQSQNPAMPRPSADRQADHQGTVVARPETRDSAQIRNVHSSSVPSRYTGFGSSQQDKIETRATSWSDEELARMTTLGKARHQAAGYAGILNPALQPIRGDQSSPSESDEVDTAETLVPTVPRPRPLPAEPALIETTESQMDESAYDAEDIREDTALEPEEPSIEDIVSPKLRETPAKPTCIPSSVVRRSTRQLSLRRQTLVNKFSGVAHREESEMSLVASLPGDRTVSFSVSVSRPRNNSHQARHLVELQSSPSKVDPSFMLSDLPEFTMHELDELRPSERQLASRLVQHEASQINNPYALAVKDLVKTLTDVSQDDPYWEDLRQLDLRDRSLTSLCGLEEYCFRLQSMDVAGNALTNLQGAPVTIRKLDASSNQLSSLTFWGHLTNLQYLDVSSNRFDSLDGLAGLYHLRELDADDNDVCNINGLYELDGLLKLRARRNKIQRVNFEGCQLGRLSHLDLCANQISSIRHLERLTSLSELKLDGNNLPNGLEVSQPMPQLKRLSLRNCGLKYLDVSRFRSLEHLDVDDNCLSVIEGISQLKNLNTLSMRRQVLPANVAITLLASGVEARTIHLSGSTLPQPLHLPNPLLNLRHLALASTGLQSLPEDFGLNLPNLRTINLNFNSLRDIRPLLNVHKLEDLSVCGNRLHRLRKSVATLARLTSLRRLDMRDNPLTQGFYASIVTAAMSKETSLVRKGESGVAEDTDVLQGRMDVARYELPAANAEQDGLHLERLDVDTRLRRRVYEILLANSCRELETLDGVAFDKERAVVRDKTWERLVKLGVIRKAGVQERESREQ